MAEIGIPASEFGEQQRAGGRLPRREGNFSCGDAREDKNKAQYGGTFSRQGVGVEGGGAPRAGRERL